MKDPKEKKSKNFISIQFNKKSRKTNKSITIKHNIENKNNHLKKQQ